MTVDFFQTAGDFPRSNTTFSTAPLVDVQNNEHHVHSQSSGIYHVMSSSNLHSSFAIETHFYRAKMPPQLTRSFIVQTCTALSILPLLYEVHLVSKDFCLITSSSSFRMFRNILPIFFVKCSDVI